MKPSARNSNATIQIIILITAVILGYIVFNTTPDSVGPTGITLFFLLIFILALALMELYYRRFIKPKRHVAFWLKVTYSFVPVLLLALSSLRQLNSVDLILGGTLITIVTVYHNRNS